MTNKKRGQKVCEQCNCVNGVRAYECKECDAPFKMKKRRRGNKKKQVEDHRTLNRGDLIRVVGGNGCHYIDKNGDRHYFTDRGKYIVQSTTNDGILSYGKHGYQYISQLFFSNDKYISYELLSIIFLNLLHTIYNRITSIYFVL